MTITSSPALASHLLELDVDITLGCNYIINWRYRALSVSQVRQYSDWTLFTAWL